jgi:hypothetical protein
MAGARPAHEMRGIDFLRAWLRGEIPPPPIGALMGAGSGRVESVRRVLA